MNMFLPGDGRSSVVTMAMAMHMGMTMTMAISLFCKYHGHELRSACHPPQAYPGKSILNHWQVHTVHVCSCMCVHSGDARTPLRSAAQVCMHCHACVTWRKLQTPGTAKEHKRQETPRINTKHCHASEVTSNAWAEERISTHSLKTPCDLPAITALTHAQPKCTTNTATNNCPASLGQEEQNLLWEKEQGRRT